MNLNQANARLSKVKLRVKNNKIYMRATLPVKPWEGSGFKQHELKTGCPNTELGIKAAFAKAQKLESDLILERFNWGDWVELPATGLEGKSIERWCQEFEEDYWHRKERTLNRQETFKSNYWYYFRYLPPDEVLTEEALTRVLLRFSPSSADRVLCYLAFKALANFADLRVNFARYKGEYKPGQRYVPSDDEIVACYSRISNLAHRWVYGMLACYGLRGHELFHLDCSSQGESPYLIRVGENTKTGARVVYPVPAWIQDWRLWELPRPNWRLDVASNKKLGRKVGSIIGRLNFGFSAYALRDAYAIRCAVLGIDSSIAARWMGHSIQVHCKDYQRFIDEVHFERIWLGKVLGNGEEMGLMG